MTRPLAFIRGRSGFSLIEVVVAVGIVGVTLIALGALVHTVPLARITHDQDLALSIAQSELESLRSAGYAALPASGSFTNPLLASLPSGSGSLATVAYGSQTKQVAVTVSWQDPGQVVKSVVLATLITKTGGLP